MTIELDIIYRLLVAAALGAVVGLEREYHHQPAGLRTHIILAVGAALAMYLSIMLATSLAPEFKGDPARLAAQVITGVGFLGAGAIMRLGPTVRGLTTAASLWTMAIIGMLAGFGQYVIAVVATGLVLIALSVVDIIENKYFGNSTLATLTIVLLDKPGVVKDFELNMKAAGVKGRIMSIHKDQNKEYITLTVTVITRTAAGTDKILGVIRGFSNLVRFDAKM
ncbi:MAG TPA: MgtC/SapB family protein [Bellilinea sp.]|nr:MgtC/SapB family protein [Bellilinea sp.]